MIYESEYLILILYWHWSICQLRCSIQEDGQLSAHPMTWPVLTNCWQVIPQGCIHSWFLVCSCSLAGQYVLNRTCGCNVMMCTLYTDCFVVSLFMTQSKHCEVPHKCVPLHHRPIVPVHHCTTTPSYRTFVLHHRTAPSYHRTVPSYRTQVSSYAIIPFFDTNMCLCIRTKIRYYRVWWNLGTVRWYGTVVRWCGTMVRYDGTVRYDGAVVQW